MLRVPLIAIDVPTGAGNFLPRYPGILMSDGEAMAQFVVVMG
jgi:hypothetical protein